MCIYPACRIHLPVCDHFFHDNTKIINCSWEPADAVSHQHRHSWVFQLACDTIDLNGPPVPVHSAGIGGSLAGSNQTQNIGTEVMHPWCDYSKWQESWDHFTTKLYSTGIRPTLPCSSQTMRIRHAVVMETDLHSAFDQIKGNNCCVCSATTQNPTKSTQDEILLRAEFTTVSLWNTVETVRKWTSEL